MAGALWGGDFVLRRGRIRVRKTGADIALDAQQVFDAFPMIARDMTAPPSEEGCCRRR